MYPKHACIWLNTVGSMPKPAWYVVLYIQNGLYTHVLVQPAAFKQLDGTPVLNISTGTMAGMQKLESREHRALTFRRTCKPWLVKVNGFFSSLSLQLALADFSEKSYLTVVYFS